MIKIFAVVFANYYPLEIDSLWTTEELADKRSDKLDSMWRVQELWVKGEEDGDTEDQDSTTDAD
jgi:hypothetical protein